MHDAAAGGHPVDGPRLDALHDAGAVAVLHGPFEQVGDGGQADVRVRAHIVVVVGLMDNGPEVVEEHERPDRLAQRRRQQPPHDEAAAEVLQMRFKHVQDGHRFFS